jgi:predicted alpha/beta hydrolase family esterase
VAWWAALERPPFGSPVAGALLVAPPDVDTVSMDGRLTAFGPAPKILLPFPSIVAASRNDPFIDFGRAHTLAKFWGAHCADAGEVGHINAQSHLGEWEYGQYLLNQLIAIVSDSQPQHPRQSIDSMARTRSVEDKVVRFPGTDL